MTASDGRTVNYYYAYCKVWLDNVVYYNNANWTARYQYCGSNAGQGLPPLLWTADDPMYPGPMKRDRLYLSHGQQSRREQHRLMARSKAKIITMARRLALQCPHWLLASLQIGRIQAQGNAR